MGPEELTLKLLKKSFDSHCEALEKLLKDTTSDVSSILGIHKLLEKLNTDLEEESNKLVHKLIIENKDEESVSKIMEISHETIIRYSSLAYSVEKLLVQSSDRNSSTIPTNKPTKFKLKLDLRKFNGDIKDWLQFWSFFKRIHENDEISDDEKFDYLLQSTTEKSKARQLIESYPPTGDNYSKAVESLRNRFGRNDLLIEYYVRELLKLVLNNLTCKTANLPTLYDKLEGQLRALDTLGVTSDTCAAMLYPLLESCLPEDILRTWQRSSQFSIEDPLKTRLENLMKFLKREVENEERISLASSFETKHSKREVEIKRTIPSAAGLLNQNQMIRCSFCKQQHISRECDLAKKMTLQERKKKLGQNGCCYRCLKYGHLAKKCSMFLKLKCEKCAGKHVPLMCDREEKKLGENSTHLSQNSTTEAIVSTAGMANSTNTPVFLQTLVVNIVNNKKIKRVRVLIDTGSQKSYILRKTANDVELEILRKENMVHALFGGYQTQTVNHLCFQTQISSLDNRYSCTIEVYDQPVICGNIVSIFDGPWMQEIRNLGITVNDNEDGAIELLIGADVAGKFYTGKQHILSCGLVLVETRFGWTIMGKASNEIMSPKSSCMIVTSMLVNDNMVSDLWNLELLGIKDPIKEMTRAETEKAALNHFRSTVRICEDSRYEVCLPWIENHPLLPTNFHIAIKRLDILMRKLEKEGYREEYEKVFKEWIDEGIIEEIMDDNTNEGHYLPHRHVVKHSSQTTVLRPVFDASARQNSYSPSLNQCLEKGANFIELIPSVLLRFRQYRIGVISDIRKAFLQIRLNSNDRHFLKFLWYDMKDQLKVFRHKRVVFGLTCSPFLLGAVIQHHLTTTLEGSSKYSSEFLTSLRTSFYVDNSIISFDHYEEVRHFKQKAESAMMEAKMVLRCWEFTESEIFSSETRLTSVLGMKWNKFTDTFEVCLESFEVISTIEKLTKKVILSTVNKIFDVIGFVSPVVVIPKILLQTLCKLKLAWNTEVPNEIRTKFFEWLDEVHCLTDLKIPRWIRPDIKEMCKNESLHLFCDASQEAYAAVIFLRTETENSTYLSLIQCKNRVAPIKEMSIPRLELLAATIGARLLASVRKGFDTEIQVYNWTDSSTVLNWIKRNETWKPFVRNRIQEIHNLTDKESWHHVPGHMNPADLPSRGCLPKKLLESKWWNGPIWLLKREENWPIQSFEIDEDKIIEEKQKGVVSMLNQTKVDNSWMLKYSRYEKLLKIVAWIKRFSFNCKLFQNKRNFQKSLDVQEIENSEKIVVRLIQEESFGEEQERRKIQNLIQFEDDYGILRLRTKISEREDILSFRFPAILPSKHTIVKRLIFDRHVTLMHAGVQTVLANLREQFWILKGKKTIKSILSQCIVCKKQRVRHLQADPIQLPKNRVKNAAVFEVTGVDAAGPMYSKDKGKIWILIFTCAIYRAVHFEIMNSMSTESFLLALHRFIARRGRPSVIYSDNGKNFVGAENLFATLDWNKIDKENTAERIIWKFNPVSAAWWGGWWERLIGLLKQLLRKILGKAALTQEELQTIVCDCEAVVNQRPLTNLSENPDDWQPLTPALFLHDVKEVGVPDLDEIDANGLRKRYAYRQRLKDQLRKRFRSEYLGSLVLKNQKKIRKYTVPKVGDLGLVQTENSKRFEWPLARIVEVIRGKDDSVRVLKLKTSSGNQILRPIQRFYPLELTESEDCQLMREKANVKKYPISKDDVKKNDHQSKEGTSLTMSKTHRVTRSGRTVKPPERF